MISNLAWAYITIRREGGRQAVGNLDLFHLQPPFGELVEIRSFRVPGQTLRFHSQFPQADVWQGQRLPVSSDRLNCLP